MIVTAKALHDGLRVPKGYGLAYWRYDRLDGIFMPVPLNVLVRWATNVYWYISTAVQPNKFERLLQEEYSRGHRHGYEAADTTWQNRIQILREVGKE